ncbi:MAG: hypothetical protein ACTSVZ_13780 [Promethearchaeota archaeon]
MSDHFFCSRCGSILLDYESPPNICPRCGGVEIFNVGGEGEYKVRDLRREHHAPFRPDIFYHKDT